MAERYDQDAKGWQANDAALQAETVTGEFLRLIKKSHINDVGEGGLSDRTVANKHARLNSWLRFAGTDDAIFPRRRSTKRSCQPCTLRSKSRPFSKLPIRT